jgi:hypothetical protein
MRTLKSFDVAQQLVPSMLKMAALSTWPVPRRLQELVVSTVYLIISTETLPTSGPRMLDDHVSFWYSNPAHAEEDSHLAKTSCQPIVGRNDCSTGCR